MEFAMKRSFYFLLIIVVALIGRRGCYITWIEKRFPLPGNVSPPGSPWPMPQIWQQTDRLVTLDPRHFKIVSSVVDCDIVNLAIERYRSNIFPDSEVNTVSLSHPVLHELKIVALNNTCWSFPSLDSDEKYNLNVSSGDISEIQAVITAESIWGVLRGLETFAQLVWQNDEQLYMMNETAITDFPRYQHRGILLDSARHFLPLSIITRNLDAMEWNKMNVLHWHIVDDQSFPFESATFPELSVKGAYSPRHVYSQMDVAHVIEYARLRGIRVILEFDTPGHTMGFGRAFPQLLTPCYGDGVTAGTPNYSVPHADYETLDPTNNFTYEFMEKFFSEVRGVTRDEYVHLGMDEVYYGCWESSPKIKEFMREHGYTRYNQVEQHYVRWMIDMVKNKGFKYITWQDPVDNGVVMSPDTIIEVWKDTELDTKLNKWQEYIVDVANKGYKIILSACWYLNYISYGADWKKYYSCDPKNFDGTEEQKELVIGGEACLWGEYADGTNLLSRLWPRASAVAERLWSAESVNNTDDAAFRLDEQRCRMLRRGIPAQPILNGYCGSYEWEFAQKQSYSASNVLKATNYVISFVHVVIVFVYKIY